MKLTSPLMLAALLALAPALAPIPAPARETPASRPAAPAADPDRTPLEIAGENLYFNAKGSLTSLHSDCRWVREELMAISRPGIFEILPDRCSRITTGLRLRDRARVGFKLYAWKLSSYGTRLILNSRTYAADGGSEEESWQPSPQARARCERVADTLRKQLKVHKSRRGEFDFEFLPTCEADGASYVLNVQARVLSSNEALKAAEEEFGRSTMSPAK